MATQHHFAENLQYLRSRKRLSQLELAAALGLTRSQIASYESGKAEPSVVKLAGIVRFFNISLERLIGEDLQNESAPAKNQGETATQQRGQEILLTEFDTAILGFESQAANLRKIAEGLLALNQLKRSSLKELSSETKSLQRDLESLFDFLNNLLQSNEEIIAYLKMIAGRK